MEEEEALQVEDQQKQRQQPSNHANFAIKSKLSRSAYRVALICFVCFALACCLAIWNSELFTYASGDSITVTTTKVYNVSNNNYNNNKFSNLKMNNNKNGTIFHPNLNSNGNDYDYDETVILTSHPLTCQFDETIKTVKFRPKEFMQNGPGKEYFSELEQNSELLKRRYVEIIRGDCISIYFHNHKVGGTTMSNVTKSNRFYAADRKDLGKYEFENLTNLMIRNAFTKQQEQKQEVVAFSLVRDPVSRFLSAIRQTLVLKIRKLYSPCHYDSTNAFELVVCIIDKMEEKSTYLNVHFIPQIFEIYDDMMGYDFEVDIMDLSSIDLVMKHFGTGPSHERSGVQELQELYPQFVLSIDILTVDVLKRICKLYHVDLLFLQQLNGLTHSLCDSMLDELNTSA